MKIFKRNINLGRKVPVIDTPDLREKCVTTGKLADGSVTTNKIADGAITREKIADGAITNLDNVVQQVTDALEDINKSEQQIQQNEVERNNTWTSWFSDVLPTGVRYLWNAFFSTAQTDVSRAITDAQDTADHPTYVGEDNYVYAWNKQTHSYNKTSIYVRGEGFHISKIFASISDMEAYTGTDLKEGDFVLIQSTPDDPDNAKLYTYSGTQGVYNFLVDMSGAIGFTGKTPQFSIGTITTIGPTEPASASLSPGGTDADGNPKYKLNLALPKGAKGTSDFVVVDDHSGAGDDPDKIYIPSANAEKELYDNQVFEKGTGTNSAKLKGADNTVTGDNSVATGEHNYVEGTDCFVAGKHNVIRNNYSFAFGQYNIIHGSSSVSIGSTNISSSQNAYAEGRHLRNSGKFSHIEGYGQLDITISGVANSTTYSIVEDLPALFIGSYIGLTVDNGFLYATITAIDDINHTITLTKTLNPDSDFVNQSVKLFCSQNLQTAGHVEGKYNLLLINDEITENPLSEGVVQDIYDAETSKVGGHIEGFGNIVCGNYAHAEGSFNLVNSLNAHVEGAYNKALGKHSHVEGRYCEAHKNFGHAEGSHTIAEGNASHAEGYYTIARGSRSSARGAYSVAIGYNTEASGVATVATGNNSHAEGSCNESHGAASHAEGFGNTAWGSCSHAGGDGSLNVVLTGDANATTYNVNIQPKDTWVGRLIKPGNVSSNAVIYISAIDATNKTITVTETLDAENPITAAIYYIALGGTYHANSFAHGKGVVTGGSEQAVFGRYNLTTAGALFVVGNGTSYDNPSNAFYIDANGNVYIAGNIVSTQIQQLESRIAALEAALNNNSNN